MKKISILAMLLASVAMAQTTPNTASLSWTTSATDINGNPLSGTPTFNVYSVACPAAGGTTATAGSGTKIASGLTSANDVINSGLADNTTECWYVTQVVAGQESAPSNVGSKTFPGAASVPPILIIK